jgi:thiamine-phosphate pyrophosphorylase
MAAEARLRGLYAVTPDMDDTAELVARVRAALDGGAALLQYRSKLADAWLRRRQAQALLACCREAGARLIVNDAPALAGDLGADGAHIGREDGDARAARAVLGDDRLLGVSCYADLERARAAQREGASYVAFGAAFASATKPQAPLAPASIYRQARAELRLPIAAIGGITLANAPSLIAAGVDLLAVIRDLFDAPDVAARAAAYAALFRRAQPQP